MPPILVFGIILGVLIFVHEAGHFVVAKQRGVRVERFSMGFGPILWRWQPGETEYALSLVPLGGYVKLAGENRPEDVAEVHPWEFVSKPLWDRFAIVAAGPLTNYALALLLFCTIFLVGEPKGTSAVGGLLEEYPAAAAGILVGDRVVAIADRPVQYWDDVTKQVKALAVDGEALEFTIQRNEHEIALQVKPRFVERRTLFGEMVHVPLIGITPSDEVVIVKHPPISAILLGARRLFELTGLTLKSIGAMFVGGMSVRESVTGPIGIFYITSAAAELGWIYLLQLVGILSMSLGIFNLLPIPVLDGGQLAFMAAEAVRGRPLSQRVRDVLTQCGLWAIVALVVVICYNDVVRYDVFGRMTSWWKTPSEAGLELNQGK